jgi:hypothetical protein
MKNTILAPFLPYASSFAQVLNVTTVPTLLHQSNCKPVHDGCQTLTTQFLARKAPEAGLPATGGWNCKNETFLQLYLSMHLKIMSMNLIALM